MKTDSLVATLKTLEAIRGANLLSVSPALTVDRFQTVVQKLLKLEHNLAFTTTNDDLCVIFLWCSPLYKVRHQYKCCDTIHSLVLTI